MNDATAILAVTAAVALLIAAVFLTAVARAGQRFDRQR